MAALSSGQTIAGSDSSRIAAVGKRSPFVMNMHVLDILHCKNKK